MAAECLSAHSLVEAFLYFRVTPCAICCVDRLEPGEPTPIEGRSEFTLVAVCRNCGGSEECQFSVPMLPPRFERYDPVSGTQAINLGPSRSSLIDLVQWVTLHDVLLEQCASTPDSAEARWLKIRAGECLDEAMKFIDDGSESPTGNATFVESSTRVLAERPDRYTRSRLVGLRSKLPVDEAFDGARAAHQPKRAWWKFW
ncbi:MAG: hypothetical protein GXP29_05640 [Planctomycetes bacterium]|nr:hypothetical protein [Planctomycetota bacterium]